MQLIGVILVIISVLIFLFSIFLEFASVGIISSNNYLISGVLALYARLLQASEYNTEVRASRKRSWEQ